MANEFNFNPVNGLLDTNVFPSDPVSEEAARGQFMTLFNQLKEHINIGLLPLMLLNEKREFTVKPNGDIIYTTPITVNSKEELLTIQIFGVMSNMGVSEVKITNFPQAYKTKVIGIIPWIYKVDGTDNVHYSIAAREVNLNSISQTIVNRVDSVSRNVYSKFISIGY